MAEAGNNQIWIQIAGLKPFELKLKDRAEEKAYREAEDMLNETWANMQVALRTTVLIWR